MRVEREVAAIHTTHHQFGGAGFPVRRPFPVPGFSYLDPFLLTDEMGPMEWAPGEASGASDHPHRGFETVTHILRGGVFHVDSAGNNGLLGLGDVQWMTAGSGVILLHVLAEQSAGRDSEPALEGHDGRYSARLVGVSCTRIATSRRSLP